MRRTGLKRFAASILTGAMILTGVPAAGATGEDAFSPAAVQDVSGDEGMCYGDLSDDVYQFGGYPDYDGMELAGIAVDPANKAIAKELILKCIRERRERIDMSSANIPHDSFQGILAEVLNEHFELYYVDSWYSYIPKTVNGITYVSYYYPHYSSRYPEGTEAEFEEAVQWYLSGVRSEWSDIEKALYLHERLCETIVYDDTQKRHNAFNGIVEKYTVCIGYSMAYKLLCNRVGVTCEVVSSSKYSHAWNRVILGGESFYVDLTWDDQKDSLVKHQYFLRSRDKFNHSYNGDNELTDDWGDALESELYYNVPGSTRYDSAWWLSYKSPIRPLQVNGSTKWIAAEVKSGTLNLYSRSSLTDANGTLFYSKSGAGTNTPVMVNLSDGLLVSVGDLLIKVDASGNGSVVYQQSGTYASSYDIYGVRTDGVYADIELRTSSSDKNRLYKRIRISDGQEFTYTPTATPVQWNYKIGTPTPTVYGQQPTSTPRPTVTGGANVTNTPKPTSSASYPEWKNDGKLYNVGDRVTYNGKVYECLRIIYGYDGFEPSAPSMINDFWKEIEDAAVTPTNTPKPTATNTPKPTATNTPKPTATSTPKPTATQAPSQNGWVQKGTDWYYYKSGSAVKGWFKSGGKWYYMSEETGAMQTGWVKDGGKWYFLDSTGAMKTGWIKDGGAWYHTDSNGVMQKNKWISDGGKWYYVGSSGKMVSGCTMTIGGVSYTFDKNGVWQKDL